MTTTYALTGDLSTILGLDTPRRITSAQIDTNLDTDTPLVDLDNNGVRLPGPESITVGSDGTFSLTLIATNSTGININDGSLRYIVRVAYKDAAGNTRSYSSGYFAHTAAQDLSDVVGTSASGPIDTELPALDAKFNWTTPTAYRRTTIPRNTAWSSTLTGTTSGTLYLTGIYLEQGDIVTNLSVMSGTTAAVTPTAQWFELRDSTRALLAKTVDGTTGAWAASTVKTLALTAPYTVTAAGFYYVGLCVVAGTVPTLSGVNPGMTTGIALPPILAGTSSTGLTYATTPATAAAITATARLPFIATS